VPAFTDRLGGGRIPAVTRPAGSPASSPVPGRSPRNRRLRCADS